MRTLRFLTGLHVLTYIPLCVFLGIFLWGLNAAYPMLGHDYFYFFPRMLAGKWHFLSQGFSPFRYSAQFCGGFPMYGNPHDIFYSLPQLLSLFIGLWTATQLSIVVAIMAGYAGWVLFGKQVIGLSREWSHVLALIIVANGYYFMHMMAGHLSWHTLPLMGWLLWLLFARSSDDTKARLWKTALFGLIAAYVFYAAGYFVIVLTGMTAVILLAFDLLFGNEKPAQRLKTIGMRAALFGGAAIALCLSKVVAVYSLMRFFPRTAAFDQFTDGSSGFIFMLKSFFLLPQGSFLFSDAQNKWGIHEYSMFLSPLVLIGCLAALWITVRHKRASKKAIRLLFLTLLLLVLFFGQLTRGYGFFVDWLQVLPIFSSFRVTVRFLYVPAILLSIGGVIGLSWIADNRRVSRFQRFAVPMTGALTILSFIGAYAPMLLGGELQLTMRYTDVQDGVQQSGYLTKSVNRVETVAEDMSADMRHVFGGTTGDDCYEPLIKDNTILTPLKVGPVQQVTDGTFTLRNPACLQYPTENSCMPGDRIQKNDEQNFVSLINGLPVTWKLSLGQRIADGITVVSLLLLLGVCGWLIYEKRRTRPSLFSWWKKRHNLSAQLSALLQKGQTIVLQKSSHPIDGFRVFLLWTLSIIGLAFIVYICAFKLLDRDFWWHITAGRVMVETGGLIETEPFSYPREGLPYLANHEWLAQVILYLIYNAGGSVAIVLFRTLSMMITVGLLFFIDVRRSWLYVPLGILTANAIRPAFIERPQLFTFMLFSAGLLLTFRTLHTLNARALIKREWLRLLAFFLGLQILWVNTHGAASLLAFLFPAVLFIDQLHRWIRASSDRSERERTMRWLVILGVVLGIGLLLSPITYENMTYVWNLFTDRTMQYIGEWRPREWKEYIPLIGPFWIIGTVVIAAGRRNILASAFLVLITGYVSKGAIRHETLFVLSVMAVAIHQLRYSTQWTVMEDWLLKRRAFTVILFLILLLGLGQYVHAQYINFTLPDRLQGYGQFDFGKSSVDFLKRENIQGKMFNTYGFGGYLMYRGYPDRKNFFDGRNVDHGFALMNLAYLAGHEPEQWKKLQQKYGFTYAVVDYPANTDQKKKTIEYAAHLDKNLAWPLVYLDDWVAIYLQDTPENRPVIERFGYHYLSTTNLQFNTVINDVPETEWSVLEKELKQAVASDPRSIKARLILGTLLIRQKRFEEAYVFIQDVLIVWPEKPEAHALLGALYMGQEQWSLAADAFEDAIHLAGKNYPDINYATVAEVFANAGRLREAKMYARKAGLSLSARQPIAPTTATQTGAMLPGESSGAPMVNPAQDAIEFHDKALEFVNAGDLKNAREYFLTALKLNPRYVEAWNNLGTLAFQEGKLEEAKAHYTRALQEWPEYPDATYNMALLFYKMGDKKQATVYAKKAHALGMDTAALDRLLL